MALSPSPLGAELGPCATLGHMTSVPYSPTHLREVAASVKEFEAAFRDFMAMHKENTFARGILPAVFRRDGVDDEEYLAAQRRVELASGRAATSTAITAVRYAVQGAGVVDPIAAWATVTQPKPVLEPANILSACGQALGRLESKIAEAEAAAVPAIDAEQMHPLVWGAARAMWRDGHYRQAVVGAAEALVSQLKARTGRNNVAETSLWQQTFSAQPPTAEQPRLRWPGPSDDRTTKSMNEGLRLLTSAVQLTIRNPATHSSDQLTLIEASERLAVLSLMARWVENCELEQADEDGGGSD